jgi:hypothetical protein
MSVTLFILVWVWSASEGRQLLLPVGMLATREIYRLGWLRRSTSMVMVGIALLVSFAFWILVSRQWAVAALFASKTAISSMAMVRGFGGADELVNPVTIRIPVVRDCLFILSRWAAAVVELLDDVRYTYSLESSRNRLSRWRLIVCTFGAATTELVDLLERLLLVISARGRYPNLRKWFTPWPLSRQTVSADLALILATVAVAAFLGRSWVPSPWLRILEWIH